MLYVLLALVVALALIGGVECALLMVVKAERRAEVAELKNTIHTISGKCRLLREENAELTERMARMDRVKEGMK